MDPRALTPDPHVVLDLDAEQRPLVATVRALRGTAADVEQLSDTVTATLQSLDAALGSITGGGQGLRDLGALALPLLGVLEGARRLASEYVRDRTEHTLDDWAAFVDGAVESLQGYVTEVGQLRDLRPSDDGSLANGDLDRLDDLRWETRAWRVAVERAAELVRMVEVLVAAAGELDRRAGAAPPETAAAPDAPRTDRGGARFSSVGGWADWTKERVSEATDRARDVPGWLLGGGGELQRWVLRPFVDLLDRVQDLPASLAALDREVGELELLLELALGQARVAGSAAAQQRLRERVAAGVTLPDLLDRHAAARDAGARSADRRARLVAAHRAGKVADTAFDELDAVYAADEAAAAASRDRLAEATRTWLADAGPLLESCQVRAQAELDVVRARRTVEGASPVLLSRETVLERELSRLARSRQRASEL